MGLIITILLGALIGWLASIIMGRDKQQGWVGNILVGIVGAIVGSLLADLFDQTEGVTFFIEPTFASIFWALVGAIAVSAALNYFQEKRLR